MDVGPGTMLMGLAMAFAGALAFRFRRFLARPWNRYEHQTEAYAVERRLIGSVILIVMGLGIAGMGAFVWITD